MATVYLVVATAIALSCRHQQPANEAQQQITESVPEAVSQLLTPRLHSPYDIYTVKAKTVEPTLVRTLSGPPDSEAVALSQDGSRLAFVTGSEGSWQLHILSLPDGAEERTMALDWEPYEIHWSPDGERLAILSFFGEEHALNLVRSDGSENKTLDGSGLRIVGWRDESHLLTIRNDSLRHELDDLDVQTGESTPIVTASNWNWIDVVAVSKDGSRAAILVQTDGIDNGLWMADLTMGSGQELVSDLGRWPGGIAWSPDGKEIAYGVQERTEQNGVFVYDVDSGKVRKITNSQNGFDWVEGWLPDGSGVVVERGRCGANAFCTDFDPLPLIEVSNDGSGREQTLVREGGQFSLSPTNETLASDEDGLALQRLPDGVLRTALSPEPYREFEMLGWSGDGRWFAFAFLPPERGQEPIQAPAAASP